MICVSLRRHVDPVLDEEVIQLQFPASYSVGVPTVEPQDPLLRPFVHLGLATILGYEEYYSF